MNKIMKNILWVILWVGVLAAAVLVFIGAITSRPDPQDLIAATGNHTLAIKEGKVKAVGRDVNFPELETILDAEKIAANGFIVVTDSSGKLHSNAMENAEISKWEDIKDVAVGYDFAIGLKEDGTLVAAGGNAYGQTLVSKAKGVKTVSAGAYHYAGLTDTGELYSGGSNDHGERNIKEWTDIIDVECGPYATVGLKKDGTVVSTIPSSETYNLSAFTEIEKVVTSRDHTVGLKKDGTVVATGNNASGQCEVSDWSEIIAVKANRNQTVGLKKDGTIVAVGDNQYGQCDVAALNQ